MKPPKNHRVVRRQRESPAEHRLQRLRRLHKSLYARLTYLLALGRARLGLRSRMGGGSLHHGQGEWSRTTSQTQRVRPSVQHSFIFVLALTEMNRGGDFTGRCVGQTMPSNESDPVIPRSP